MEEKDRDAQALAKLDEVVYVVLAKYGDDVEGIEVVDLGAMEQVLLASCVQVSSWLGYHLMFSFSHEPDIDEMKKHILSGTVSAMPDMALLTILDPTVL